LSDGPVGVGGACWEREREREREKGAGRVFDTISMENIPSVDVAAYKRTWSTAEIRSCLGASQEGFGEIMEKGYAPPAMASSFLLYLRFITP